MVFDSNFIEEVKEKNDIVEVISDYIELKGGHGRWKGLCPFHNEKTPSFSVNEVGQYYKCFGCQKGGDVISFIQEIEKADFSDAVKFLAKRAMISLPEEKKLSQEEREKRQQNNTILEVNLAAAKLFRKYLFENAIPKEYFKKRELNRKTILHFGLGYAPFGNVLYDTLKGNYEEDVLLASGLFIKKEDGSITCRFKHRVMFPIFSENGKIIGFGGRALGEGYGPKYLNSPETPIFSKKHNLYAYNFAKKEFFGGTAILAEGYMDTITLHKYGFTNTVASLGTAFTKEQAELLKKKKVSKVYIAYDSDEAGRKAAVRAMQILYEQKLESYVIFMKGVKDPDDYLKKYGVEKFKDCMEDALNIIDFHLYLLRQTVDFSKENQQLDFIKNAVELLKRYEGTIANSHILIERAIKKLAEETGISVKALGQEMYGKYFSPSRFSDNIQKADKSIIPKEEINTVSMIDQREKQLLYYLSKNMEISERFSLLREDFAVFENQTLFDKLLHGEKISFDSEKYDALNESNVDLEQLIDTVKKDSLRSKIEQLKKKQSKLLNSEMDEVKLMEISLEIIALQKKLK